MTNSESVVHSDPEICGGQLVFIGTRVPLWIFVEHMEAGVSLEEFLDDFPTVTREQAVAESRIVESARNHANLFTNASREGNRACGDAPPIASCNQEAAMTHATWAPSPYARRSDAQSGPAVHSDSDIRGGELVFVGTRVPLRAMLDYLEAGDSLNEFLEDFPSVSRSQAVAALRQAEQTLVMHAHPSR